MLSKKEYDEFVLLLSSLSDVVVVDVDDEEDVDVEFDDVVIVVDGCKSEVVSSIPILHAHEARDSCWKKKVYSQMV